VTREVQQLKRNWELFQKAIMRDTSGWMDKAVRHLLHKKTPRFACWFPFMATNIPVLGRRIPVKSGC